MCDSGTSTPPAKGETLTSVVQTKRPEDDLLLLAMRLDDALLGQGIRAYHDGERILLPLGELSRLLELAITVTPKSGTAEGWILEEDRTFRLDHGRGELVVDGERAPLPEDGIEVHPDDIFVDAVHLGRWLPVDFEIDFPGLLILATPREPLPLQQRLERERHRRQVAARVAAADHVEVELPYPLWSAPFADPQAEVAGRVAAADHPAIELPHPLWSTPPGDPGAKTYGEGWSPTSEAAGGRLSALATGDAGAAAPPHQLHSPSAVEPVDERSPRPAENDGHAAIAPADEPMQRSRPDDGLLVLALWLEGTVLSEGMLAYHDGGRVLLPLGELSRLLELAITVTPKSGTAEGWILEEDRTFRLDHGRGELVVDGERAPLPEDGIEVHPDDIFVDAVHLGRWLPVDFEIDFPGLLILATPREPLPLQQRLERERHRSRLSARPAGHVSYPRLDVPYRAWSPPFVDLSAEGGYGRRSDAPAALDSRYSMLAMGDVLYMTGEAFLAGDEHDPLTTARLRFGRADPDAGLLGPLQATEFAVGDIVTPRAPLLAPTRAERGFLVSNQPLQQPGEFDRTTLIGDLQVGWEVELYRNDVLLAFQPAPVDGRYVFDDVPLLFGLNTFRLVFYGPQGQTREEIRRTFVGPGLVGQGEHRYRASLSQRSSDLFEFDGDDRTDDGVRGRERYFLDYEAGLSDDLSLAAGLASLPLENDRHQYASLGLRGSLGSLFGTVDGVVDPSGGQALRASARTRLLDVSLLAEHDQFFSGFVSEDTRTNGDRVVAETALRADGHLAGGDLPALGYSLGVEHQVRESNHQRTLLTNRLSTRLGAISVSNTLRWPLTGGAAGVDDQANGSLLLSDRIGRVRLRGFLDYGLSPDLVGEAVGATADWQVGTDLTARLGVAHDLNNSRDTSTRVSLSRHLGPVALGVGAQHTTDGSYRVGFTMSMGFGRDPRSEQWAAEPRRMASRGAASVRVFQDNNANGEFDRADRPLENVEVRAAGHQARANTDAQGLAFITGIPRDRSVPVTLAANSLEDPFLEPTRDGMEIVGRPGAVGVVDFPVVMTSEVEGTVFVEDSSGRRELPYIEVELVDERGVVVQSATSAFDGFYLLQRIKPGRYTVRPNRPQMAELNLTAPPPQVVTFDGEDGFVQQIDVVLTR